MRAITFAAIVSGLIAAAPISAAADQTITETFSLTIPPSVVGGQDSPMPTSTPFPLFARTTGKLDNVSVTISGTISAASIADNPSVEFRFYLMPAHSGAFLLTYQTYNIAPSGKFNINQSVTKPDFPLLFEQQGNAEVGFDTLRNTVPPNTTVLESDGPLMGLVTFDYTPASVILRSPSVPESSTWVMMLLGFGGLGFAGFRRTVGSRTSAEVMS